MAETPRVILSGFADEAAHPTDQGQKAAQQQFTAFAALGLQYFSVRFIDLGGGPKNVMKLTKAEIQKLRSLQNDYGLNVSSIGSPLGKVKLREMDDGSRNAYIPFEKYLAQDVQKACELAHALECKLIRGFSFYPPLGSDPRSHLAQAADQLARIAETCHRSDLTFGLEVETNLVGQNGYLLAEIHRRVNHPAMVLVFDAANLVVQGFTGQELLAQFRAMAPGLGWMHVKDYRHAGPVEPGQPIDEDALAHFVPADQGDAAHERLLLEFRDLLPKLERKLRRRGIPGVFLDLEPHLKGGGQFGGFSGPDGMGVALRSLCRVLDYARIDYHLRDFDDIKAARGF